MSYYERVSLRGRAEALLDANIDDIKSLSAHAISELLHELNVHKIELEMQNQELCRTQLDLEASRSKYFTLYEFSPIGYFRFEQKGIILEVNIAGADLLRMGKEQLIERKFYRFVAPFYQQSFSLHRQHALQTKEKQLVELELIKADGTSFFARLESIVLDKDADHGEQLLTSVMDISELKQMQKELESLVEQRTQKLKQTNQELQNEIIAREQAEKQLQKYQKELTNIFKLNVIGEISSTLAHEINQPLAAISTYVDGCIHRLENNSVKKNQLIHIMNKVAQNINLVGEIIHRMNDFTHRGKLSNELALINDVVEIAVSLIHFENKTTQAMIHLELAKNLPPIYLDKIQIIQVILNLTRNSIEAMRDANTIQPNIFIRTRQIDPKTIAVNIKDTGPGIEIYSRKNLFTPHWTTKLEGVGIGLAISRTIIEAHGGQILFIPSFGGGASFQLTLPIQEPL